MKFIEALHRGRARKLLDTGHHDRRLARRMKDPEFSAAFQERAAWYSLHPARNVKAAPINPPVKENRHS